MKCPYYDKEMELGYIQNRDGVYWTPKKSLLPVFAPLRKNSISLDNGACDTSATIFAYRCDDCKKVIIDYSKNQTNS